MNVEIIIDGKDMDLNDFVQRITFEVSSGLIRSLRDVPDWSSAEIKIQK